MDGAVVAREPPPESEEGSSSSSSSSRRSQVSRPTATPDGPYDSSPTAAERETPQQHQQQQQVEGFEDVEVYMVCPATVAWATARSNSSSSNSSSSSSSSAAAARAAAARAATAADASVLRACQWLIKSGCIRSISWQSPLVLQGELLHFGIVLLPQQETAAAAGVPAAVRAWLAKYASLSASVDLLLRGSSSSSSKTTGQSALSCQFWEAQAFPIDSQEIVSVKITHCTYTPAAAAAAAAAGENLKNGKETAADATHCCIICDVRIPMSLSLFCCCCCCCCCRCLCGCCCCCC